jgi:uncharacterized membrane protein YGL010W
MSASVATPAELLNVAVSAFGHCLRLLTGDASATVRSPTSRRSIFSAYTSVAAGWLGLICLIALMLAFVGAEIYAGRLWVLQRSAKR